MKVQRGFLTDIDDKIQDFVHYVQKIVFQELLEADGKTSAKQFVDDFKKEINEILEEHNIALQKLGSERQKKNDEQGDEAFRKLIEKNSQKIQIFKRGQAERSGTLGTGFGGKSGDAVPEPKDTWYMDDVDKLSWGKQDCSIF